MNRLQKMLVLLVIVLAGLGGIVALRQISAAESPAGAQDSSVTSPAAPTVSAEDVQRRLEAENKVLRETIRRQAEELKALRVQLESLRGKFQALTEKLSRMPPDPNERTGENTSAPAPAPANTQATDPSANRGDPVRATITIDGKEIALPPMDLTRPSSQMGSSPFKKDDKKSLKSWQETIPRLGVGEFGKIYSFPRQNGEPPYGCQVVQILGPEDMTIEIKKRIGPGPQGWGMYDVSEGLQRIRLHGMSTKNLVDDQKIALDDAIAIIGTWSYGSALSGAARTILLAVPLEWVKHGQPKATAAANKDK
jgi:hypothetical protein